MNRLLLFFVVLMGITACSHDDYFAYMERDRDFCFEVAETLALVNSEETASLAAEKLKGYFLQAVGLKSQYEVMMNANMEGGSDERWEALEERGLAFQRIVDEAERIRLNPSHWAYIELPLRELVEALGVLDWNR